MIPVKLAAVATVGTVVELAAGADGPTVAAVVQQAAATVTAVTVLAAAGWWLVGPRVRDYLRGQRATAAAVDQVATRTERLPDAAEQLASMQAQLSLLAAELAQVRDQLHDHLVAASAETRLVAELMLRAAADERTG